MMMQDYHKLRVWQRSSELAELCYRFTASFPNSETFGLVSQIRRSAVSIPSNIAEGSGRGSQREFSRFLRIAYGSACELETQVSIARRVGFGDQTVSEEIINETEEIRKMIAALIALTSTEASP